MGIDKRYDESLIFFDDLSLLEEGVELNEDLERLERLQMWQTFKEQHTHGIHDSQTDTLEQLFDKEALRRRFNAKMRAVYFCIMELGEAITLQEAERRLELFEQYESETFTQHQTGTTYLKHYNKHQRIALRGRRTILAHKRKNMMLYGAMNYKPQVEEQSNEDWLKEMFVAQEAEMRKYENQLREKWAKEKL